MRSFIYEMSFEYKRGVKPIGSPWKFVVLAQTSAILINSQLNGRNEICICYHQNVRNRELRVSQRALHVLFKFLSAVFRDNLLQQVPMRNQDQLYFRGKVDGRAGEGHLNSSMATASKFHRKLSITEIWNFMANSPEAFRIH